MLVVAGVLLCKYDGIIAGGGGNGALPNVLWLLKLAPQIWLQYFWKAPKTALIQEYNTQKSLQFLL